MSAVEQKVEAKAKGVYYEFKQAVKLGEKVFSLGVHEVEAELEKLHGFKWFQKRGAIVKAEKPAADKKISDLKTLPPAKSPIAQKAAERAKASQNPPVQPDAVVGDDDEAPAADADKKGGKKGR